MAAGEGGVSGTTDWLSAAGGIVGAIGGPAGLWAAWSQHQQNRRRRYGPPEELVELLAKIIDTAQDVTHGYRNDEWMDSSGLEAAKERLSELIHLVRDAPLRDSLTIVGAQAGLVRTAVALQGDNTERTMDAVTRQARYATDLVNYAQDALKRLRRQL
ncbi:hypothetical protein [Streptomyces bauhiniae]